MNKDSDNTPSPDDTTEEAVSPPPTPGVTNDPLIGTKIGSCTLKRLIGSGGMGTVYEAMQENPRRRVAIKMMKRGITSRSALRRFKFESQTLARLQHPHIAQVYEAGTHDDGYEGVPYFVMEYISSAKSLTEYATDKGLGTRSRLAIFSKVCDAVQHGHLKGIIHRDLKPSNILVGANGQPKIIDFGVARSTDSDLAVTTLQTDVGQLIGTLQYMSPEQCEADPSDIDARSDVYALGVTLYELLAGRPPYDIRKAAIHEAVRIILEEEPTKLSSFGKHLHGDIETISLKSLEKNRDRRYQTVVAFGEDIQRYLDDEQISARPPSSTRKPKDKDTKGRPWWGYRLGCILAIVIPILFLLLMFLMVVISTALPSIAKARDRAVEMQAERLAWETSVSIRPLQSERQIEQTLMVDFEEFVKLGATPEFVRDGMVIVAGGSRIFSFLAEVTTDVQPNAFEWEYIQHDASEDLTEKPWEKLPSNEKVSDLLLHLGHFTVRVRAALDVEDSVVFTEWFSLEFIVEDDISFLFRKVFTTIGHPFAQDIWSSSQGAPLPAPILNYWGTRLNTGWGLYIFESSGSSVPTRASDWLEEQDRLPVNVKRDTIERRIRLLEQAKTAYDAEDTVQLQEILELHRKYIYI